MSWQAYLDAVEKKTGKTPQQIVDEAHAAGYDDSRKVSEVVAWLKGEYGIGHGHATAMSHVVRNGAQIGDKHVGTTGSHRDESDVLRLDGIAARETG
jgi:hypothetical protein